MAPRENEHPSRAVMNVTIHRVRIGTIRVSGRADPAPVRAEPSAPEPRRQEELRHLQCIIEQLQREMAHLARTRAERAPSPVPLSPQPGPSRARSPPHSHPILTPTFKKSKRLVNSDHRCVENLPARRLRQAATPIELAEGDSLQVDSSACGRALILTHTENGQARPLAFASVAVNRSLPTFRLTAAQTSPPMQARTQLTRRCWNCRRRGHRWSLCTSPRESFCTLCGSREECGCRAASTQPATPMLIPPSTPPHDDSLRE